MKYHLCIAATLAASLFALSAQAAQRTVRLTVHHAGCTLCAPIVKGTLERVKGVKTVTVSQANGNANVTASVTYNDATTNVPKLIAATTQAGYPSDVAQPAHQ